MMERLKQFMQWVFIPFALVGSLLYYLFQQGRIAREHRQRRKDGERLQKELDDSVSSLLAVERARERYEAHKAFGNAGNTVRGLSGGSGPSDRGPKNGQ